MFGHIRHWDGGGFLPTQTLWHADPQAMVNGRILGIATGTHGHDPVPDSKTRDALPQPRHLTSGLQPGNVQGTVSPCGWPWVRPSPLGEISPVEPRRVYTYQQFPRSWCRVRDITAFQCPSIGAGRDHYCLHRSAPCWVFI